MKRLPLLLATALLVASAAANDQVRDVQGALKAQGFYYGEVTGMENAETGAAIRRFQIRNGISVTGKLTGETLSALGLGEKKTAAVLPKTGPVTAPQPAPPPAQQSAPAPPVAVQKQLNPPPPVDRPVPKPGEPVLPMRKAGELPPDGGAKETVQNPVRRAKPNGESVVDPPTPVPPAVSTPFSTMFRDTPYAAAPRDVQVGVIRRAQAVMAARRFYRGPLDGVAGPATSEAIFLFQDDADLRRTGRLDLDTLAEMNLLPQPPRGGPLLKPFYNPNRRRDPAVSWDYWIR
jgi:peptidoglycan hydrolase-like protein with peptidoglycan-binding domain